MRAPLLADQRRRVSKRQSPSSLTSRLAGWLNDSVRHLRRLVDEQRIPHQKVGHFVRFDEAEITDWFAANRHGRPGG